MLGLLRWDERELYEKIVMAGLGAAMVLVLLWFLAISPVLKSHAEAEIQSNKALRDYEIVSKAAPQLSASPVAIGAPLTRSVLIDTARAASVKLSRVQPDGDALTVWVEDVETVKLYGLMNTLITRNGAELMRASITTGDSGLLSAQLTLKTGN